jgi:pimeloyl-ACP methyl ester carboxylesterase
MRSKLLVASLVLAPAAAADGQRPDDTPVRNVVLVHGAYADGSSYAKVIPLLRARGFRVTAVQNPLTSLADDVAATQRALARQDGPTILVGHSSAGVVITEAGNDPKVVGSCTSPPSCRTPGSRLASRSRATRPRPAVRSRSPTLAAT